MCETVKFQGVHMARNYWFVKISGEAHEEGAVDGLEGQVGLDQEFYDKVLDSFLQ